MFDKLEILTKDDLKEMGDIFGTEISFRMKRKEMVESLSHYFVNNCKRWLSYMLESDLNLIKALVDKGPRISIFLEYSDYISLAEYFGIVESDESDGNFKKVWLSQDVYEIVKDNIGDALKEGEESGRFEMERVALGYLNLYGVDTFSHFLDFMMSYSLSKNDANYDLLLDALKHSPLLKISRFEKYIASPCVSDPMSILKRRRAFKGTRRNGHFSPSDAMEAGRNAPYFTFGLDTAEGSLVWTILGELGYDEQERYREMHNIWTSSQLINQDETANDLFISVLRKQDSINDFERYSRYVNAIADYANKLPKWLLKGNSSYDAGYLEIVFQESDSDAYDLESGSIGDLKIDKDGFVPDWHLPKPTVSNGYPALPDSSYGMAVRHVAPDDPCPCGSGLKYKNCHGRHLS